MILALLLNCFAVSVPVQPDLNSLVSSVMPTANEDRWLEIPWRTDLGAALKEAERERKPVYMWVMDGHPLGCT
jgi:hypothetical protein